jgi:hypothetical protein
MEIKNTTRWRSDPKQSSFWKHGSESTPEDCSRSIVTLPGSSATIHYPRSRRPLGIRIAMPQQIGTLRPRLSTYLPASPK